MSHTRLDRGRLLDAAAQTLAGNPGASMQDIATSLGIGRASLHRLFPGRQALLDELALHALAATDDALNAARLDEDPIAETTARLVEALLPVTYQFAFLAATWEPSAAPDVTARTEVFMVRLEAFVRRGQTEGAFDTALPARWVGLALMHLLIAAAEAVSIGEIGRREAPRLVLASFLRGVQGETRS